VKSFFLSVVVALSLGGTVASPRTARAAPGSSRWNAAYFPNVPLVNQDGKTLRFYDDLIKSKIVMINFIFTSCPDVCPLLTAKFAAIQRALAERKIADYQLLSITTDPERDSASVLKEYAGRFKADLTRWSFVTGTRADLTKVWKAMGVNVTKTDAGEVSHTTLTTLVDRRGTRRVDYYGDKWLDKEVLNDFQRLAAQK
jgi:protein SCO1/2